LGHKPSFVWRSICNAKFILRAGSRWKIGDGSSILIWNNNWLVGNGYLTLQNHGSTHFDNLKDLDCIIPEAKAWNVPFLLSIFDQHIVNQVVNTPLYPSVHDDSLFGRRKTMVSILLEVHIKCVCKNYLMSIILRHKDTGI